MQMEGSINGVLEQPGSSDDGQILAGFRNMMKKEVKKIVIEIFQNLIVPTVGNLVRNIVNEELQSAQERLLSSGNLSSGHELSMSAELRILQLKFLDEVSVPVLTGKQIKGKGDTHMRLAIVDTNTGQFVNAGPEASAKVEILLLEANQNESENHLSLEEFNGRIIRENDKTKPHFAKCMYVYLKEGIVNLSNVKMGHDKIWKTKCKCRLGARIVDNFSGSVVKNAWTESFKVEDSRSKLYKKHYPPSLSDEVWRLDNIGREGKPCKRLKEEKILTVRDFRFLLTNDPKRLQENVPASAKKWAATVKHAQTCIIDDKKMYLYSSESDSELVVTFDVVGQLKGMIRGSQFVPIDNLSEAEKAHAHDLILLAFENRNDMTFFDDETCLLREYPYISTNDITASTNSHAVETPQVCHSTVSEHINYHVPSDPCTSSWVISHLNTEDLYVPCLDAPLPSPSWSRDEILGEDGLSSYTDAPRWSPSPSLGEILTDDAYWNNFYETSESETHYPEQNNAGRNIFITAMALAAWIVRAKKRIRTCRDNQVGEKRQRIGDK